MSATSESQISLTITIDGVVYKIDPALRKSKTLTGTQAIKKTQSASTTTAAVNRGALASCEEMVIVNLSTVAGENLNIGLDNATPITQVISVLFPGDWIKLSRPAANTYINSATGAPRFMVLACEQ